MSYRGEQTPISSQGNDATVVDQAQARPRLLDEVRVRLRLKLRLMACVRLRVKDVDFARYEITVREGNSGKDRKTVLPACLREALRLQVETARLVHVRDLAEGFGEVLLPHALARKFPNAPMLLAWQYVFPASRRSIDPRDGAAAPYQRKDPAARGIESGDSGRHRQAGQPAHAASLLRDASAGIGIGHPHGAGTARAQGPGDDADLYACTESRRGRGAESAGSVSGAG